MTNHLPDVNTVIEEKQWLLELENIEKLAESIIRTAWQVAEKDGAEIPENGYAEIGLFLVNDAEIKELNREYRKIDKPTNVLSFPALDDDIIITEDMPFLAGDIIVALETTRKEAEENCQSLEHHFAHLLIHGCLHLAGYDHENDEEAEIMESLETKILAGMGIKNPYAE